MNIKRNNPDYQHGPVRHLTAAEIAEYEASAQGREAAAKAAQADYSPIEREYVVIVFDADTLDEYETSVLAHSPTQATDRVAESLRLGERVLDVRLAR